MHEDTNPQIVGIAASAGGVRAAREFFEEGVAHATRWCDRGPRRARRTPRASFN